MRRAGPRICATSGTTLIEDYSSRFMTKETDKLVALRGIISKYHQSDPPMGEEIAGMWMEHLPSSLLWQSWRYDDGPGEARRANHLSAFHPRRPMAQLAPSWSWASLDGLISYQVQRVQAGFSADACVARDLARVLSCSSHTEDAANETGGIASLTTAGQLASASFSYTPIQTGESDPATGSIWTNDLRLIKSEAGSPLGSSSQTL